MNLAILVLLPFLGAALPPLAERLRAPRTALALSAALMPALALALLIGPAGQVFEGRTVQDALSWMPSLGLTLAFRLDGLALLFALLVLGIGLLVILYARYYLSANEKAGRFYAFLLLFMGAMLGVVTSDNLLLLVLFWELTSLSSFLLIGFWSHQSAARKGARMALTVTGMGGLAFADDGLDLAPDAEGVVVAGVLGEGPAVHLPGDASRGGLRVHARVAASGARHSWRNAGRACDG